MKTEFLKELGLEQDKIDKIFAEHGKTLEEERTKATKKVQDELDGVKAQLKTANESLEKFKDIKPEELQGEITKLKEDLANKDKEYQNQIAERDFSDLVKSSITSNKGKSDKAIMALLDLEALKSSKNQKEDIITALEKVKEESPYLFDEIEGEGEGVNSSGKKPVAKVKSGGKHGSDGAGADDGFMSGVGMALDSLGLAEKTA